MVCAQEASPHKTNPIDQSTGASEALSKLPASVDASRLSRDCGRRSAIERWTALTLELPLRATDLPLWVQQALPGQLAQTFAANMAPGDPSGAMLSVRIDSIYLDQEGPADPDSMRGVATPSRFAARQTSLPATSTYVSQASHHPRLRRRGTVALRHAAAASAYERRALGHDLRGR